MSDTSQPNRIAVLHQAVPPPEVDGVVKPMKPGGYQDSAADIAYVLRCRGHDVVTPIRDVEPSTDTGWSYPDTMEGIEQALDCGATVLWANTYLFVGHPIERVHHQRFRIIGQPGYVVDKWDAKSQALSMLADAGLPVPDSFVIQSSKGAVGLISSGRLGFPVVVKPVRGRGSEGVVVVRDIDTLDRAIVERLDAVVDIDGVPHARFGYRMIVEEFLPGRELTVTVMPPGMYTLNGRRESKVKHWVLPLVERTGHWDNVAPYNGVVAVIRNSSVVVTGDCDARALATLLAQCERAAELSQALAPVRIDCRARDDGEYQLFDLNLKPNMTGPGRPSRADQDSLSCLAARAIGWDYGDLLEAMLDNAYFWPAASALRQA
jgi:D-alanine-D-alanine ligase